MGYRENGRYYDKDGVETQDPSIPVETFTESWPSYEGDPIVPIRAKALAEKNNPNKKVRQEDLDLLYEIIDALCVELSAHNGTVYRPDGSPINFNE